MTLNASNVKEKSAQKSKLQHALDWSARGFKIFPLRPNTKIPAIKGFSAAATADREQIQEWWRRWPDANIGAAADDWVIVDVDTKAGKRGLESLEGLQINRNTLTVRTQSGGLHLYFWGAKCGNSVEILGPESGLDLRGAGGFVVAPGSTIDGRPYSVEIDREPALVPDTLDSFLRASFAKEKADFGIADDSDSAVAQALNFLENNAPIAVAYQGGNQTTFNVAAVLTRDFGLSVAKAMELMLANWNDRCEPPWAPDELEVIVENAERYGKNPRGCGTVESALEGVDLSALAELVDYGDAAPDARPGGDWRTSKDYLKVILPHEMRERIREVKPALIEGFLDSVGTSLFFGASQSWKSFGVIDMCDRIAAGEPWAGRKTQQGLCVYIAAEAVESAFKRVEAVRIKRGRDDNHPFVVVEESPNLFRGRDNGDPGDVNRITRTLRKLAEHFGAPVRFVVVDTFSKSTLGIDGNSEKDVAIVERRCDEIAQALKCQFAIVHHSGKDVERGAKGSSTFDQNFAGKVEFRTLTDDKGNKSRVIIHDKIKDGEQQPNIPMLIENVVIGDNEAGEPVTIGVVTAGESASEPFALSDEMSALQAISGGEMRTLQDIRGATKLSYRKAQAAVSAAKGKGYVKGGDGREVYALTSCGRNALNEALSLDGIRVDDPGDVAPDMEAAKTRFMELIIFHYAKNLRVYTKPSSSAYAPKAFAEHALNVEGYSAEIFKKAMDLLFAEDWIEKLGPGDDAPVEPAGRSINGTFAPNWPGKSGAPLQ